MRPPDGSEEVNHQSTLRLIDEQSDGNRWSSGVTVRATICWLVHGLVVGNLYKGLYVWPSILHGR